MYKEQLILPISGSDLLAYVAANEAESGLNHLEHATGAIPRVFKCDFKSSSTGDTIVTIRWKDTAIKCDVEIERLIGTEPALQLFRVVLAFLNAARPDPEPDKQPASTDAD